MTEMRNEDRATGEGAARKAVATGSMVAFATLLSRITGFVKAVLVVTVLWPSVASAFSIANQIPNMVAELALGAVLTAAVVPVLVRAELTDEDGGTAFTQRVLGMTLTVLAAATLLSFLAGPQLLHLLLDRGGGKVSGTLAAQLLVLLVPQVLFYGLFSLGNAILSQRGDFQPGAWAPVVNNLVAIGAFLVFALLPDHREDGTLTPAQLLVLGLGTTFGVVAQAVVLLPALRRAGVRLAPKWGLDARLKQFANTAAAMVCYVVISQAGLLVAWQVAARADAAGPLIYQTVWLLAQLPYGVFGVTIIAMMTPQLSRAAAAGDDKRVVADLSRASGFTMTALLPITALMAATGPLMGLSLFWYGTFDQAHARTLGEVLSWSVFAIVPYALVLVQLRVFYARQEAWTPTWIVVGITAVKIGGSYLAPVLSSDPVRVQELLGVANGLGYLFGAVVGFLLLRRSLGPLGLGALWRGSALLAAVSGGFAVLLASVLAWGPVSGLFGGHGGDGHGAVARFALLALVGAGGLAGVYAVLWALRAPDVRALAGAARRRAR